MRIARDRGLSNRFALRNEAKAINDRSLFKRTYSRDNLRRKLRADDNGYYRSHHSSRDSTPCRAAQFPNSPRPKSV